MEKIKVFKTAEELERHLPKAMHRRIDEDALEKVNNLLQDTNLNDHYRDSMLLYSGIVTGKNYTITQFVEAIKYTTIRLSGATVKDSFIKVFPERYQEYLDKGYSEKDIGSYMTAYNRSKIVQNIMEQAYIPTWLLNQDYYQEAINTQVTLMKTAKSEKVRSDAANSLLNHLKAPEKAKLEMEITVDQDKFVRGLRDGITHLVEEQRKAIEHGNASVEQVAESRIIEGEFSNE